MLKLYSLIALAILLQCVNNVTATSPQTLTPFSHIPPPTTTRAHVTAEAFHNNNNNNKNDKNGVGTSTSHFCSIVDTMIKTPSLHCMHSALSIKPIVQHHSKPNQRLRRLTTGAVALAGNSDSGSDDEAYFSDLILQNNEYHFELLQQWQVFLNPVEASDRSAPLLLVVIGSTVQSKVARETIEYTSHYCDWNVDDNLRPLCQREIIDFTTVKSLKQQLLLQDQLFNKLQSASQQNRGVNIILIAEGTFRNDLHHIHLSDRFETTAALLHAIAKRFPREARLSITLLSQYGWHLVNDAYHIFPYGTEFVTFTPPSKQQNSLSALTHVLNIRESLKLLQHSKALQQWGGTLWSGQALQIVYGHLMEGVISGNPHLQAEPSLFVKIKTHHLLNQVWQPKDWPVLLQYLNKGEKVQIRLFMKTWQRLHHQVSIKLDHQDSQAFFQTTVRSYAWLDVVRCLQETPGTYDGDVKLSERDWLDFYQHLIVKPVTRAMAHLLLYQVIMASDVDQYKFMFRQLHNDQQNTQKQQQPKKHN